MPSRKLILVVALLLAGCASGSNGDSPAVNRYQRADPVFYKNWAVEPGQSVLIVGFKLLQNTDLLGRWPGLTGGWVSIDPATRTQSEKPVMAILHFGRAGVFNADVHPREGETDYVVYKLPPGNYALAWLAQGDTLYPIAHLEHMVVTVRGSAYLYSVAGKTQVESITPVIELHANEVVYAGNVVVDMRNKAEPKWARERNDDAARAALQGGDKLPGEMIMRPIAHLDGTPPQPGERLPLTAMRQVR